LAVSSQNRTRSEEGGYRFGDISRSILKDTSKKVTGKESYKFGDISRWLDRRAKDRISSITGNDDYVFGDLARWADEQAKARVNNITGREGYVFGDLTRWVDGEVKAKVNNYTKQDSYRVGDLTAEVIRRIQSGEIEFKDVWLALRVLISVGVPVTPIAAAMPAKMLVNLVSFGLSYDVGGRALEAVAQNLDERLKQAITGDSKYKLGDIAKREIEKNVMGLLGKDDYKDYKFGDITRKVTSLSQDRSTVKKDSGGKLKLEVEGLTWSEEATKDLEDWDRRLLDDVARKA
jgi:hypothetical protein